MKTREAKEVYVFFLCMDGLTVDTDDWEPMAFSTDEDKLTAWYNSLKVNPYFDGGVQKYFKKGSPLENYKPIESVVPISLEQTFNGLQAVAAIQEVSDDTFVPGIYGAWFSEEFQKSLKPACELLDITYVEE